MCVFQQHAPADLYMMTKNPEDSPNTPDVLEIEFKNGPYILVAFVLFKRNTLI